MGWGEPQGRADHDDHTLAGVGTTLSLDDIRNFVDAEGEIGPAAVIALCDEVTGLRAENAALAAALEDIAGMRQHVAPGCMEWVATAECLQFEDPVCHVRHPDGRSHRGRDLCPAHRIEAAA